MVRPLSYQQIEGRALSATSLVYRDLRDYEPALTSLEQSLPICQAASDIGGETMTLSSSGTAYLGLSQYEQAIDVLQQAAAIAQSIGNRTLVFKTSSRINSGVTPDAPCSRLELAM